MENNTCYNIKDLSFTYSDGNQVINNISLDIPEGKITTIIGPNGSGKSTLLYLLTREFKKNTGEVRLFGKEIEELKRKSFARQVASVYQYNTIPEDTTVREMISYGRIPHKGFAFENNSDKDLEKINWAMDITGLREFENRVVSNMSGGQQQRVWIAMALAQESKVLFLDEPTTYLDLKYQIEMLELIHMLNRDYGITIIMVLHDLNQALSYSDITVVMAEGKVRNIGKSKNVITEDMIKEVYGVHTKRIEVDGRLFIIS